MLRNMLSLLLSKFYSKKDAALVAHQAIPELSQYIDLASSTTTNVENTYVAPTDGYFVCATKGGEGSGVNVWGTLDVGAPGAIGIQGKVFAPCAKGVSVHYIIYGTIHLVRFYKTIGGGYQTLKNALLQGGGLCLSHWYSSLQRNSYRTSGSGWLISQQFLFKALLNYLLLQMEKVTHSRCRTRGLSTSEVMEFGLPILEGSISSTDVNDDWGSIYQGVMPNDGVLVVSFTGTNESSYAAGPGAQSLVPWANGGGKFSMPVTKGSYVSLGGNHVKDVELRLYPLSAST